MKIKNDIPFPEEIIKQLKEQKNIYDKQLETTESKSFKNGIEYIKTNNLSNKEIIDITEDISKIKFKERDDIKDILNSADSAKQRIIDEFKKKIVLSKRQDDFFKKNDINKNKFLQEIVFYGEAAKMYVMTNIIKENPYFLEIIKAQTEHNIRNTKIKSEELKNSMLLKNIFSFSENKATFEKKHRRNF